MGSRQTRGRSARGQTIIEFALIAPVFFLLLYGIIDFGMALDRRLTLQHAVREVARYAAVTADCPDIELRATEVVGGIIDVPNELEVSYYRPDDSPVPAGASAFPGDVVQVSVPFEWQFPLVSRFGVGPIDTDVSGSARLELAVPDASGGCP